MFVIGSFLQMDVGRGIFEMELTELCWEEGLVVEASLQWCVSVALRSLGEEEF